MYASDVMLGGSCCVGYSKWQEELTYHWLYRTEHYVLLKCHLNTQNGSKCERAVVQPTVQTKDLKRILNYLLPKNKERRSKWIQRWKHIWIHSNFPRKDLTTQVKKPIAKWRTTLSGNMLSYVQSEGNISAFD